MSRLLSAYRAFRFGRMVFTLLFILVPFPIIGLLFCVAFSIVELGREARYRREYGPRWEVVYETDFGSLAEARARIVAAIVGGLAIIAIVFWLYRILRRGTHNSGGKRRHRRRHHGSLIERVVRYRRNAMLGIYFGVLGIAAGVALVLFRCGIFANHDNEAALGLFVFLAGYSLRGQLLRLQFLSLLIVDTNLWGGRLLDGVHILPLRTIILHILH